MVVCVVDSWNYGAAAEVDEFGVWPGKSLDFRGVSGRSDSFPTDRERLHIRLLSITGKDLSVEQNQIWGSLPGFRWCDS